MDPWLKETISTNSHKLPIEISRLLVGIHLLVKIFYERTMVSGRCLRFCYNHRSYTIIQNEYEYRYYYTAGELARTSRKRRSIRVVAIIKVSDVIKKQSFV